jgi:5-methylcytosine-specific restriction endonuclease McrA
VNKFKIFERDGFKCFYCGKTSIEDNARLLLDHVIPLSKRGETSKENLVTCCTECNASKGGMMIKGERLIQIQDEIKRRNS